MFMKLRGFIFTAVAAVLAFSACEQKQENLGTPSITISQSAMEFEVAGGNQTLILNATRDWKVKGVPAWLAVSPEVGEASAADQTVTVTALANEGGNRSADVTFSIGTFTKTLKVTQKGEGGNVLPPVEDGVTPIAEVLASTAALPQGTTIQGVVISNMALNNLTSKKGMYVQDATGGLQFYLAANHTFAYGTMVKIDLSGVSIGDYNGAVQVNGLSLDKIEQISTGNTIDPKTVTMDDFLANKYEGQYITLENVQVKDSDLAKTFVAGTGDNASHTSINMEDANGKTFVVFSSKYASYGEQTVPQGSGKISGISSINNGKMQIIFAQESDFAGLTGARFSATGGGETPTPNPDGATVVTVAQFLAAPVSTDVLYQVTGTILAIEEISSQYKNATFTMSDASGNLYVYRMKSGDKDIEALGLNVNDEITVVGNRGDYNGSPQMINGQYVSHVDKEAPADNWSATIVFADKGYTNGQSLDGVKIDIDENVTATFAKGGANNAPAYYDSGKAVRMYQNGATLEIKAVEGKTITKIEFTYGSNMYYMSADSGELSAEAPVRTWTGSANTVNFTATGTTSTTRAYVAAIKIAYK